MFVFLNTVAQNLPSPDSTDLKYRLSYSEEREPLSVRYRFLRRIDSTFIPNSDTITFYLKKYYNKKREAEQAEFKVRYKFKLLTFLPDVGLTFSRVFFASWGSGKIVTYLAQKQREKSKLETIERVCEVDYNNDLALIINDLNNLKASSLQYNYSLELYPLETQLFEITEKGYKDKKILPSDFIMKKIHYKQFLNNLNLKYADLCALKYKILANARVISWAKL